MEWRRIEEDREVVVSLKRINTLPKGPWDKIVGFWKLESEDTLSDNTLFMRWDRQFINRLSELDIQRGIWHIDAHSPTLRLINDNEKGENNVWAIEFPDAKSMIWHSRKEEGLTLYFKRQIQ